MNDLDTLNENEDSKILLIMWDQLGLETVIDVTEEQKSQLFNTLITSKDQFRQWLNHTVSCLTMRARFNSQRHYEVYMISVDNSITAQDIRDHFESSPQSIVDLIRDRGTALWDGRATQAPVIF